MPSIGLDMKAGRGWGVTRDDNLFAFSLGCICLWWMAGDPVVDQLHLAHTALTAARDALKMEKELKSWRLRDSGGRFVATPREPF